MFYKSQNLFMDEFKIFLYIPMYIPSKIFIVLSRNQSRTHFDVDHNSDLFYILHSEVTQTLDLNTSPVIDMSFWARESLLKLADI